LINIALGVHICVCVCVWGGYLFNQIVFLIKRKENRIWVIYLIILIRIKHSNYLSECLFLSGKWAICQLCHGENKLNSMI
jgi:hypothetical protein